MSPKPPPDPTVSLGPPGPDGLTTLPPAEPAPAAPPIELPGYHILGELGRGGMGVVYLARQAGLNRPVALKMVLGDDGGPSRSARFLAEAEAVAAIRHPHVVQVHEYGEHAGRSYFAMEYVDGGSLAGHLRAVGRLAPRAAAELVLGAARGVAAAHALGIVHRDLKPANILLQVQSAEFRVENGSPESPLPFSTLNSELCVPKVSDFGLAKRATAADLTRTGAVFGTPAYMAPEQAAGRAKFAGPPADVYALGVVLFECLAGRPPFEAADPVALLVKVVEDDPPPVRGLAPGCPRDLEAVCRKCLAKDPAARYPTAAELADDLARFLAGEPVAARATGLFGRVAGVLDRSLKDVEFAAYGSVLFGFAAVTLAADAAATLTQFGVIGPAGGVAAQYGRLVLYLGIVWAFRRGRLLPRTAAERQLWSIVGGYVAACTGGAIALRLSLGWAMEVEPLLYQMFAALAALTFFALGSVFWGWCYVFGAVFLAAAAGMAADLRLAPLVFGTTWAGVMTVIGFRLRQLARARAVPAGPGSGSG